MAAETGFRPLPWEHISGEDTDDFPPDATPDGAPHCGATSPGPARFRCTHRPGHDGIHQAGTGQHIVAEWRTEAVAE